MKIKKHLLLVASLVAFICSAQDRYTGEFGGSLRGFTMSQGERISPNESPFTVRVVQGRIQDSNDRRPLEGVLIELRGPGESKVIRSTKTDENGLFKIKKVPPGEYMFKTTKPAWMSLTGKVIVSKDANPKNIISLETEVTGH